MTNATFVTKQEKVNIRVVDDIAYIYLCLNEKEEDGYYKYDYSEFYTDIHNINLLDVRLHPENYVDFILTNRSMEDIIKEQQKQIDKLTQCILDLSKSIHSDKSNSLVEVWVDSIIKQPSLEEARTIYESCPEELKYHVNVELIERKYTLY